MKSEIPAIEMIDVSYRYPRSKKVVIKDLNLTVKKGEFIAVMGENGAGKSTFCQILNGIIPHSLYGKLKGNIRIHGLDTQETPISILATKIGIVLDDPENQLFTTSVLSEVAFGPENLNIPVDEIRERIRWALEVVGLTGFENRMPNALSGGQKQRLVIAAALAMAPSILVLDEATSQIDPLGVFEVLNLVKELNEKYNMTIVMTTDQSEEVTRLVDRVIVLDNGQIVGEGTPREVFSDTKLFSRFMIRTPQVSQLGTQLMEAGFPLPVFPVTVEEAASGIIKIMNGSQLPQISQPIEKKKETPLPNSEDEVIRVENLDYVYQLQKVKAVEGVGFTINKGEFVALIGQNGSGKTTVLKNLLGLLKPTTGRIVIVGLDNQEVAVADLARHVGFVLQNPDQQLFAETVEDEIAFGPKNLGLDEETIKNRVNEALVVVGLEDKRKEFPPALSKGERAKVVIACALALDPEIIVLDEPTTGQDFKGCHQIMQIARTLNEAGRTIVFVTHHMALVAEYAQRVIVMQGGHIMLDSKTENVFDQIDLIRQSHIIPPQITTLSQSLPAELGLPRVALSVSDFANSILEKLKPTV